MVMVSAKAKDPELFLMPGPEQGAVSGRPGCSAGAVVATLAVLAPEQNRWLTTAHRVPEHRQPHNAPHPRWLRGLLWLQLPGHLVLKAFPAWLDLVAHLPTLDPGQEFIEQAWGCHPRKGLHATWDLGLGGLRSFLSRRA